MVLGAERILPLTEPVGGLADYLAAGGGEGLAIARSHGPDWVISMVAAAGLRGRGGAGAPTAAKWRAVRAAGCPDALVVCNAAEGEPGTFKDRFIIRRNPYQVLEGLAIAALAVGASRGLLVIKQRFEQEVVALLVALDELHSADLLGPVPIQLVFGPDEYLFGEEHAVIEAIGCAAPPPRVFPPYRIGPPAGRGVGATAMNNVETLAHVPEILRLGADWFRSTGTAGSPGRTVFTVSGDVCRPGVHELPLGIPLRILVDVIAGGVRSGRRMKAVVPGASGAVLTEAHLDTPLDFDSLRATGSLLGSAGFVVYDDSACIVAATLAYSRFLAVESCAKCPACRRGIETITDCLARIEAGAGAARDLDAILATCATVTGGQRCALPSGEAALVRSALRAFRSEFEAHLGRPCPRPRDLPVPMIVDYDEVSGRFRYDS